MRAFHVILLGMHKILLFTALLGFLIPKTARSEEPEAKLQAVNFETHDGYFVSNQFEPKSPSSFVVLKDQGEFDKVFGAAVVMGDKSKRIPAGSFGAKLVVAAIHRGKAMVTYSDTRASLSGKTLTLSYTSKSEAKGQAEFACPLILSIDKGAIDSVRFVENGKEVHTTQLNKP